MKKEVVLDLGVASAYGDAVAAGYTGTKEEFSEMLANLRTYHDEAVSAGDSAIDAAMRATSAVETIQEIADDAEQSKIDAAASATAAEQSAQAAADTLAQLTTDTTLTITGKPADAAATGTAITELKRDIGNWYVEKSVNSQYPFIQMDNIRGRVYFKLLSPIDIATSFYVYASSDNWQTRTTVYSQVISLSGTDFYFDLPEEYSLFRFTTNLSETYSGTYAAIIHVLDDYSVSQYALDAINLANEVRGESLEATYSIGSLMEGTNFQGFYLNANPYRGIASIGNTVFNIRRYSVEQNKLYYLYGKGVSLNAELPVAAFGTEEVETGNNYIEKILDGHTTGTDYIQKYIPARDGYIYVAWITNKEELKLYTSEPVSDAVNRMAESSYLKPIKIQLFGDSITDNQWGDKTTWANYISQMMPEYDVTVVNDAVGGSGIGHGASKGTTESHQTEEYNYVWDLVSDGTTLQTDANYIIILAGTNNWASGSDLGDMSSTGTATIYGALKAILEYISQHSVATVFVCTIPQRYNTIDQGRETNANGEPLNNDGVSLTQYCEAFKTVSAFYGMPCIDLNGALGWNRLNISRFSADGLHPNATGDKMIAALICNEIRKHIGIVSYT